MKNTWLVLVLAVACTDGMVSDPPDDPMVPGPDGGSVDVDSGSPDASVSEPPDASTSAPPDAGMVVDAGSTPTRGSDGGVELDPIPTNFDAGAWLSPAWGNGMIPPSGAPDVVGAFRFICNPAHLAYDDPIVYPGQPGRSHLHQFFGNTLADAHSTYASLRTSGDSTCNNALNRSAYWIPAMMNGKGKVVRPDHVSIYYKRYPASSPRCTIEGKACIPLPRGLRYVFGWNPATPTKGGGGYFNCDGPGIPGVVSGHFPDIPTAAQNCPMGARLGAVLNAPSCWNGTDLDSPDHRSHVTYPVDTHLGYTKCPDTHPYIIPTFTLGAWYTVDADLDRSGTWTAGVTQTWHLHSDLHAGTRYKPGTTLHGDWFGAWDDAVMAMWTENCIDKLLNCSGGDLGNGLQLKMWPGFSWNASPRVVDPPP